ncbi:MAG: winged helix-turn-helix domain-containing protein [Desulfosalsimonadaceae bacterium]
MSDLFTGLITSKTRIKLLLRFFLNVGTKAYLRELSREFQISSNAVREELNQLAKAKLLNFNKKGRQIYYEANRDHPLLPELTSMVRKVMGIDGVIDGIVNRLGAIEGAYLIGDYAEGKDTGVIDLLLIGHIDRYHLEDLSRKTERYINRKIRCLVLNQDELKDFFQKFEHQPKLLLWQAGDEKPSADNTHVLS